KTKSKKKNPRPLTAKNADKEKRNENSIYELRITIYAPGGRRASIVIRESQIHSLFVPSCLGGSAPSPAHPEALRQQRRRIPLEHRLLPHLHHRPRHRHP